MIQEKTDEKLLGQLKNIKKFIGHTPLFPINRIFTKPGVQVYAKLEWMQLGGSVKARPAYNIMREAVEQGFLTPERHILDASSGNTAIAYAAIGAATGIPVTICIPDNATHERKLILKSYGAHIIFTPAIGEMNEAQETAKNLSLENPDQYYYADQYSNPNNWKAHYHSTSEEIFQQTNGRITHFVAGLGTTGTFVGTSRRLKEINPEIHCISLQPNTAFHGLEGWKHLATAHVPDIYDASIADQNLGIDTLEAYEWMKRAAQEEGLLLSPSSAANLAGAIQVANQLDKGVVVTVFPDAADKYSEVVKSVFN